MTQSPPTESAPDGGSGKTRLDRELEEILAKNENIRLLPPPPKPPVSAPQRTVPSFDTMIPARVRQLANAPIVLALLLAVAALFVSGVSPLASNVLSLTAVASIVWPMVQRFRRPSAPPEMRMWRGQIIETRSPTRNQSPLDGVREWWNTRNKQ